MVRTFVAVVDPNDPDRATKLLDEQVVGIGAEAVYLVNDQSVSTGRLKCLTRVVLYKPTS